MKISRTLAISTFVFSAVMNLSTVIYYNRSNPYVRPEPYFYLLSVAVGIIAFQILTLKIGKWTKIIIFWEIFMIAFSFTVTQQALYKTVLGRDPWTHGALVFLIIETHHVPHFSLIRTPYVWLPNFHLIITYIIEIMGLPYKWASYTLVMTSFVLTLVIIYALFRKLGGSEKITMLSLLLVGIADNVLGMVGIDIIPNSVGVVIALLIFWRVLIGLQYDYKRWIIIAVLLLSLSLLHTLSYAFVIMEIGIIVSVHILFQNSDVRRYIGLLVVSIVVALFVWGILAKIYLKSLTVLIKTLIVGTDVVKTYSHRVHVPIGVVILSKLGMLIYFGLVGIGFLRYFLFLRTLRLSSKIQNAFNKELINIMSYILFSMLIVVMSFSFFLPSWAGIAHRFWYYGEILSSIFVAFALLGISTRTNEKFIASIVIASLVIGLSSLMFVSSLSNDDNPLVKEYSIRTGWYDSELSGALFSVSHEFCPFSDFDFYVNLKYVALFMYGYIPNFAYQKSSFVAVRPYLITQRYFFWGHRGSMPVSKSCISKMLSNFSFIYNSGGVITYACSSCNPLCG